MKKPVRQVIPISNLLVNPGNPRFEPVKNQQEAIELMLDKKGSEIKKLATDIIKNGLNPSKNLIVVKSKNNKFLTLEGNRRVICTMLLNNPNKTTNPDLREFFQNLRHDYSNKIPANISCIVFENEDDAHRWILFEHTGLNQGIGVLPWDPEQKDRFLKKFSRSISIFDFADDNDISRRDVDPTNLGRLISTPYVCDNIGIAFSEGQLKLVKTNAEVKKNLNKIFTVMSENDFKVRDIYTKEHREQWIDDVIGSTSKPTMKTKTTSTSKGTAKKSTKSLDKKHLIPQDCDLRIKPSKINNVFLELRDKLILDGSKGTPNAVGVLFRVFLELSIDHYLEKKGFEISYGIKLKEKINKSTAHMKENDIATQNQLKYIRKTASSGTTNILNIENFHDYVHSSYIRPEPGDLKAKWGNLQGFFEILWDNV